MANDRPDEQKLAAWRSMLHGSLAVTGKLAQELEDETGLPLTWYDVLLNLEESGGSQRMQELARSVLLSKSGVTRLVDRMENAGYIRRQPCEGDRRGMLAVMTADGRTAFRRAAPAHLRGIEAHFGQLVDEEEAAMIKRVFDRLRGAVGESAACDNA